ncbi:MAG: hypothetical protein WC875_02935 [Candidatus Absconditabacterales bacterium]|jgi:hypothetical protein
MKTKLIAILSVAIMLISACQNDNNQRISAKTNTFKNISELPTISLDSLSKLNINITLWAESKEDYEALTKDTLERVNFATCEFIADMSGSYDFVWSAMKKYMKWISNGSKMKMFDHQSGEKFVVIGFYYNSPDAKSLHFTGDLYKY